jgi:hypothetical protein
MMAGTEPSGEISLRSGRSESGLTLAGQVHYSAAEVYDHASEGQAKKLRTFESQQNEGSCLRAVFVFVTLGFADMTSS